VGLENRIEQFKNRVLAGKSIDKDDAFCLLSIPIENRECIDRLIDASCEITRAFASKEASLCSLMNAKSGACAEDCKFCSQSSYFNTNIETYPLADDETILNRAKEVEAMGATHYCLVTAQKQLTGATFETILNTYKRLREETNLQLDASIGILTEEQAGSLKDAGVSTVNHNLETSERFFPEICTTHRYEDRKETIRNIKNQGMKVCSGGIIGMGEKLEDRIEMVFTLKELEVDVVPINILNPRWGTPLARIEKIHPLDIIKTIAVFRFILPDKVIKLAAGREDNLGAEWQPLALKAGANGMIIGGYLTTEGNPPEKDLDALQEAGYEVPSLQVTSDK
jgi:biotin synthase